MSTAPALHDLLHLPPTQDRALRVLPAAVGGTQSKLNLARAALIAQAVKLRAGAAEARQFIALPSQRAPRIAEMAAAVTAELRKAGQVLTEESQRINKAAASARAVADYGDVVPFHVVMADGRLVDRFFTMPPEQRAATLQEMTRAPAAHLRMTQALLRQDPELSGLTREEHEGLRMAALAELQPDLHAAIQSEKVQAAHLREAMRLVAEELRQEAPSALTELGTIDPQTAQMLHG